MSGLRTIGVRDLSTGAVACVDGCAEKAFASGIAAGQNFGRLYAGVKTDTPLECARCHLPFDLAPTADGLYRNLEGWVNYESRTGLHYGAIPAYAKLAAVALECATTQAWSDFAWSQQETRDLNETAPSDHERWATLRRMLDDRCDLFLFTLADGTTTTARSPLEVPLGKWVACVSLTVAPRYGHEGSDGLQVAIAAEIEHSFRGAAALREGAAAILLPRDTTIRLTRLTADGREQPFNAPWEPTDRLAERFEIEPGPPDVARVFNLAPMQQTAHVIALDDRRPTFAVDTPSWS